MWQVEEKFCVVIGGNRYIDTPNVIVYKGESIFRIRRSDSDGMLGIDFDIFDKSGNRVATVRKGIVVQGNEDEYEIKTGVDRYTVTERASGNVICDIKRRSEAQGAELDVSVQMYLPDGFFLNAGPTATNIGGSVLSGNTFQNCGAGISIG